MTNFTAYQRRQDPRSDPVVAPFIDLLCWNCGRGRAVTHKPPLCKPCREDAQARWARFFQGSRFGGRSRSAAQW